MKQVASAYRSFHASTASGGQLVVMLYEGAARFLEEAARAYRAGDSDAAGQAVTRAERILLELMASLDLRYDLAGRLLALYRFMFERLADARRRRDAGELERVRGWLVDLKDAWQQADRQLRSQGTVS
ncbi:MAG: flagellar export chaperone FliS [Armatimonadota bacterium]|nr:flagellar export chaperone FliS [Armatimonadota bacterium]MDW8155972.1 flagellar export chaperone FliS [Armatimonadota bacterium]